MKLFSVPSFGDNRGCLTKIFTASSDASSYTFADGYFARSEQHVFRGLHRQRSPFGQTKRFLLLDGEIVFFALEQINSDWILEYLRISATSSSEMKPAIIASHKAYTGYFVLSEESQIICLSDTAYQPQHEEGINPSIAFCIEDLKRLSERAIISEKDRSAYTPAGSDVIVRLVSG